jgi:hypothetical protein
MKREFFEDPLGGGSVLELPAEIVRIVGNVKTDLLSIMRWAYMY